MNQTLPNSTEAEQALISSMLSYSNSVQTAVELGLHAEDFYVEAHKRIYGVMMSMYEEGKPIDPPSLLAKLNDLKMLNAVGGINFILELADTSVSSANTKYYVELIQDKAYLRNLIITAQQIAQDGYDTSVSLDDVMDKAEKQLLNVTRTRRTSEFKVARDVVKDVLENIQKMSTQHSSVTGTSSGFRALDRMTNGFQRGDLIILAARPSMGKTTFAMNLAESILFHTDLPVVVFSMEMPAESIVMRLLSSWGAINQTHLRSGQMNEDEWGKLSNAIAHLHAKKLYIDDSTALPPSEVRSRCRRIAKDNDGKLGMVMVDYLQLMKVPGLGDNRVGEISEISRSLKALAREMNCPVVALSQLNRSLENRPNKRPIMSDLRESGAIEQDADLIMFIYRDEVYNENSDAKGTAEIIIGKQRNGPIGTVRLSFEGQFTRFGNLTPEFYQTASFSEPDE